MNLHDPDITYDTVEDAEDGLRQVGHVQYPAILGEEKHSVQRKYLYKSTFKLSMKLHVKTLKSRLEISERRHRSK